jgi:type I restriction enzyme, S subunit
MTESIIGPVPNSWHTTTLGDLCSSGGGDIQTGPFGSQLHAADYVPVGIPSVMPQNLGDNVILDIGIARIRSSDASRLSRYLLKAGDIVYSRRGDVERRALVRPEQDGWLCGTGCLRVRVGDSADSRFVSYYLGHPDVREWIVRHAVGATMPNLNTSILSAVPTVLPPRRVQRAIASTLGALDDKIATNSRLTGALDELTRELFNRYFIDRRLPNLPPGWREGSISDLCTTQYGYTTSAQKKPTGPKFLRVTDINKLNWIEWDSVPYCSAPTETVQKYAVRVGDILVARMADPGKCAIIEDDVEAIFASYLVRLKTETLAHAYYLYGFLKSTPYMEYAAAMTSGSVQANMNAKIIVGANLPIPPLPTMEKYLNEVLPLRQRLGASLRESRALTELRDTLLPKLMSGKIRVRDAEKIVEEKT